MAFQTNEEVLLNNINTNLEVNTEKTSLKTFWLDSNSITYNNYGNLNNGFFKPSNLGNYGIYPSYDTMMVVYKTIKSAAAPRTITSKDGIDNLALLIPNIITEIDSAFGTTISEWVVEILDLKLDVRTTFSSVGTSVSDIIIITATFNLWITEG